MWSKKARYLILAFSVAVLAAEDGLEPKKADQHAFSKTIHFILTVILELFLPSLAAALAIADKFHWSLFLQYILTGYLVFDVVFLSFPDDGGHENRTSKGTGWFLAVLFGIVVFVGTLINGSNLVINKFYPHRNSSSNLGSINQYGLSYKIYEITSFLVVPTGWVRVCLAPIALFGFCYDSHTGQCIAHGIMGSSFILYGFVLSLVLIVPWIRCHPDPEAKSQDFYDSCLMWLWGLVNTFTEHRWGKEPWSHGDFLHTFLGLIWWAGASAALFITRSGGKRTLIPSLLLIFTAYAMKEHGQHQEISVKVHTFFGMALASAGLTRIVEILFILKDKRCSDSGKVLAFQHLPPFCLVLAWCDMLATNILLFVFFSLSALINSLCECCATKISSAEVIHPEHARQSAREIWAGERFLVAPSILEISRGFPFSSIWISTSPYSRASCDRFSVTVGLIQAIPGDIKSFRSSADNKALMSGIDK